MNFFDNAFNIMLVTGVMGFLPLIAVSTTAFVKIAVVIFIVRNALGIQQLPPNIVVYSVAVILSAYIAAPVLNESYAKVEQANLTFKNFSELREAGMLAKEPLEKFLKKHTDPTKNVFFIEATKRIWPPDSGLTAKADDLAILVPSFLLTQLTRGFEMGFLLFIPFMAIDIVVTTILLALGMSMVSPTSITIPFKLMLFVMLDGWSKIIQGLILSYG